MYVLTLHIMNIETILNETQDAVLPKHLSKPHHLSRDSIPLPKNYTASSHLKKNLVRGSLQVRFAELIILLRFCFFMAIGCQYVGCVYKNNTAMRYQDYNMVNLIGEGRNGAVFIVSSLRLFNIFAHVCIVWSFCCFCVCCVCSWLMNLFWVGWRPRCNTKGWNQKQSIDRKFQKKTDSLSWNGGWNWGAAQDQWTILCVQSPSQGGFCVPVQTNVHIEFDEF